MASLRERAARTRRAPSATIAGTLRKAGGSRGARILQLGGVFVERVGDRGLGHVLAAAEVILQRLRDRPKRLIRIAEPVGIRQRGRFVARDGEMREHLFVTADVVLGLGGVVD